MKNFSIFLLLVLILCACNPEDSQTNSVPVISINGSNETTVSLQGQYSEQGATANDIEDGDITSNIVISGSVNTQYADLYRIYYDVIDSDGNKAAQVTRNVKVKNDADYLDGYYNVSFQMTASSGNGQPGTRIDKLESSKTENNKVYIPQTNMIPSSKYLMVSNPNLQLIYTNNNINYNGTGVINSNTNFTLVYPWTWGTMNDVYVKQ
ncbi:MAG: DUF5011 domain-containing protein [Bacteroidota bacterium]